MCSQRMRLQNMSELIFAFESWLVPKNRPRNFIRIQFNINWFRTISHSWWQFLDNIYHNTTNVKKSTAWTPCTECYDIWSNWKTNFQLFGSFGKSINIMDPIYVCVWSWQRHQNCFILMRFRYLNVRGALDVRGWRWESRAVNWLIYIGINSLWDGNMFDRQVLSYNAM